jgi:ribonuclease HII
MSSPAGISYRELVRFDRRRRGSAFGLIAGVDEAGRGALAGPVVAAAVICEPHDELVRVRDSKTLIEPVREELYEIIRESSLCWGVGIVGPHDIDRMNILNATLAAMREAIDSLDPVPCLALVDGPHVPATGHRCEAVRDGDRLSFSIAAASIIAKVTRDRIMRERERDFPGYGFARNKGYGTREHIEAIRQRGMTDFHRKSFHLRG